MDDDDDDDDDGRGRRMHVAPPAIARHGDRRHLPASFLLGIDGGNFRRVTTTPTTLVGVRREYHATTNPEKGLAIVMTLGAIAATAKAGQYGVEAYREWREGMVEEKEKREEDGAKGGSTVEKEEGGSSTSTNIGSEGSASSSSSSSSSSRAGVEEEGGGAGGGGKRENVFARFFDMSVGSKYYEGEFR